MKNSYSRQRAQKRTNSCGPTKPAVFACLLALSGPSIPLQAASAPPATLIYTTTNNAAIQGGIATIGSSGDIYFSILSSGTIAANVKKLSVSGAVQWTFNAPDLGPNFDMFPVPALDAAGAKLYIGSDAGIF